MKMQRYYVVGMFVCLLVAVVTLPAQADRVSNANLKAPEGQNCSMQGEGTISINYNSVETDILGTKPAIDAKIKGVMAMAKDAGIDKIELQYMNYNVNSQSSGGCGGVSAKGPFQLSGGASFKITAVDQGPAFVALLLEKGYNASFNVNMSRQCGADEGKSVGD